MIVIFSEWLQTGQSLNKKVKFSLLVMETEKVTAILAITDELRDIEKHIRRILKQANTDCEDFAALKHIIETITI